MNHPKPFQFVYSKDSAEGQRLRELLPRLFGLLKPQARTLGIGFIFLALGSGINLFFPYFIRQVLNGELGFSLRDHLNQITLGLIGLFAIQAVCFYWRHYTFQIVGYRVVADLRQRLFGAMLAQDIAFFDEARMGDLLSRLTSDTDLVQRGLTINVSVVVRYALQVIGGTVLMVMISPQLTLGILLLIPLIALAGYFWGKRLSVKTKRMQAELAEAGVIAEESLGAIRVVKIFAGVEYELRRFSEAIQRTLGIAGERTKIAAGFSSSVTFLIYAAIAGIFWFGGKLVLTEQLTFGDLSAFLLYCVIVAVSFGFLLSSWDEFQQAVGASQRVFSIIDLQPQVRSPLKPRPLRTDTEASLLFDSVSFSYPARPEVEVLKDISFEVPAGSTIALVGPSGAGKSTVAQLAMRFYDPSSGEVRLNGIPLKELAVDEMRTLIGFVPQQPQVFSVSIGENARYGKPNATEAEIQSAIRAAQLEDFVRSLPEGLNTLVGDRGVQLSGGERQRLAIARALLKNPRLLILDEATSALDSQNEFLVKEALRLLMKSRTTLTIAHRLSTVQHADLVLVLQEGRVIQAGKHDELARTPGLYSELVAHQLL